MTVRGAAVAIGLLLVCSLAAVPVGAGAAAGGGPPDETAVDGSRAAVAADAQWRSGPARPAASDPVATGAERNATLAAAYPNPVAAGDPGEFVVVAFDRPVDASGWTITDGKTAARLPNRTLEGPVALSTEPSAARAHTDHRVLELEGRLRLADAGDRLRLIEGDDAVDAARYRNAPESALRDFRAEEWRPVGATDLEPFRTDGGRATAFVLPDAPDLTVERVRRADERLLVGGYTFTSERLADALVERHEHGVEVRLLLDGAPVAGPSARQARLLDRLTDAGVDVRVLAGPHARYRHHHPKYAVVDDEALVLTENFKPAGTGGMSSRGWGIAIPDAATADALADLHRRDREWRAATPWERYRAGREFADPDPALGSFEARHEPERVDVDATTVLVSPDNAEDALVERLAAADERILVQQVAVDGRDNRLLRAALEAAERGVRVRVHLSDAWYVEDDNAELAAWLNRRAGAEGWDLEAKVDDPDGYEKVHAKGVVVDDAAVVGSLNWERSAARENREVLVVVDGADAADYYASVFASDWRGDDPRSLPAGVLGGVAAAVAAALLVARRVEFLGRGDVVEEWRW